MKKIILLSFLFFGFLLHAQCTITGKSTISLLSEEIYSVANEIAQCKDCHLWTESGTSSGIFGDNRQSSVKFRANSAGRQVLSVSILTQKGLVQCSKNIDIVENNPASENGVVTIADPEQKVECNIKTKDLKEVKYAENIVSFFPLGDDISLKYTWTATYFDGREIVSKEKVPQFPFSKTDGIKTIKLQMISDNCMKILSKSYDSNYWEYFK